MQDTVQTIMPILPKIQLVHTFGPCLPVPDKDVETGTLTDNMGYHAKYIDTVIRCDKHT